MKRILPAIAILCGFCAGARSAPTPVPGAATTAREIVSPYIPVFEQPPREVPSFKSVDGPITGNGDIGLTVSGPPEAQRYWISKNDFWKSGPDFKQSGPSLIGGLDIRSDDLKNATYHVEQHLYGSTIRSRFSTNDAVLEIDARVTAEDNVIVLTMRAGKRALRVNLNLWAKDGSLTLNGFSWSFALRCSAYFPSVELQYSTHSFISRGVPLPAFGLRGGGHAALPWPFPGGELITREILNDEFGEERIG